jgi:hypothetical protein
MRIQIGEQRAQGLVLCRCERQGSRTPQNHAVGERFDQLREHEQDAFEIGRPFELVRARRDREAQGPT